ncbi:unnamed protein product [Arabidopsis lyrata]|nr:unnamed protein product [Arabidopsis lyrata]
MNHHPILLCSAATVAGLRRFHFRTRSGVEYKVVSWFDESFRLKKRRTSKMAYKLDFESDFKECLMRLSLVYDELIFGQEVEYGLWDHNKF